MFILLNFEIFVLKRLQAFLSDFSAKVRIYSLINLERNTERNRRITERNRRITEHIEE